MARFPLAPLRLAAGEESNTSLAKRLGLSLRSVLRHQADGMSLWKADQLAIRCELHPGDVWPSYWLVDDDEVA